jgi:FkbM family methyltransferase
LSQNISYIKKNFRINNLKTPKIIKLAVSNKKNTEKFYLGNLDSHGTLCSPNYKNKLTKYINVKTLTLERIMKDNKIEQIDFLKVDCEGGEGLIIESIKDATWKQIGKMAIEYHDSMSTLPHLKIVDILKDGGYLTKTKPTGGSFGYIYAWKIKST